MADWVSVEPMTAQVRGLPRYGGVTWYFCICRSLWPSGVCQNPLTRVRPWVRLDRMRGRLYGTHKATDGKAGNDPPAGFPR
jgi:hypothetical protein